MDVWKTYKNNTLWRLLIRYDRNELPEKIQKMMQNADIVDDMSGKFILYRFFDSGIKIQEYPNTIVVYVPKSDIQKFQRI